MDVTHPHTNPWGEYVAARVAARTREIDGYFTMLRLTTAAARASALGINERTIRRTLNRETRPSADFIAATLAFFGQPRNGGWDFADLFTVIDDTDPTDGPHLRPVSGVAA